MWHAYMGAPWTRDGTVRVYVVTMAPEVAGRIVELPVADNQFVHKGDSLIEIDPDRLHDRRQLAPRRRCSRPRLDARDYASESQHRRPELTQMTVTVTRMSADQSTSALRQAQAQHQQADRPTSTRRGSTSSAPRSTRRSMAG